MELGEPGECRVVGDSNVEVGEIVNPSLPYTLVVISEAWPEWLLVTTQPWARIFVFSDVIELNLAEVFVEALDLPAGKVAGW